MTEHNFFILSQKFFHNLLFWRKFNSLQLHVSQECSKNASFGRYGSKHYRSFSKSTFCFEDILSMETPIEVRPKRLVRGLLELSKKSKNSQKCGKLSKIHHLQVGQFWRSAQREILLKINFFANGLAFSSSKLVPYTIRNIQAQCHAFLFYFSI